MEYDSIRVLIKELQGTPFLEVLVAAVVVASYRLWSWLRRTCWTLNITREGNRMAVSFSVSAKSDQTGDHDTLPRVQGTNLALLTSSPRRCRRNTSIRSQ